ncbi:MAG: hypothetical protein Q8S19_08150 [Bacillota bacterium]|nr:hypothetical protein [Bacillota bacterium]
MYIFAFDVTLAMLGVLIGLACESVGLTAVAVLSMADMLSLSRPRKEGLGDDYASLAVAVFVAWAGVSLVLGGVREAAVQAAVHPIALITAVTIIVIKLVLMRQGWLRQPWLQEHYVTDAVVLGLLVVSYFVTLLSKVYLEPGLVVIIGVLVLYEAIELMAEAIQEIRSAFKR